MVNTHIGVLSPLIVFKIVIFYVLIIKTTVLYSTVTYKSNTTTLLLLCVNVTCVACTPSFSIVVVHYKEHSSTSGRDIP